MKKGNQYVLTVSVALFLALFGTGCSSMQSTMRADPPEMTGFLPGQPQMSRESPQFPFHYFYARNTDGKYKNIYVAPVNTEYLLENDALGQLSADIAQEIQCNIGDIAEFMRQCYIADLRKVQDRSGLTVVDDPNLPDTLVLYPAITQIVPTKATLSYAGLALSICVFPGFRLITTPMASGSISVACKVVDSRTGEIVMMYADREKDVRAVLNFSSFTWYSSSKVNIEMLAEKNAQFFTTHDYDSIERGSPIRFWSW